MIIVLYHKILNLKFVLMSNNNIKIGHGYDVHKLENGKKFVIGGIEIDHYKGAVGHSDADIVIHVICDALLGAMAQGDIGSHFPDTDESYKNIDVTVLLEKPKLRNHIDTMRSKLSEIMDTNISQVSIKATTTEGLGFVGREEGIAAHCVCLISQ